MRLERRGRGEEREGGKERRRGRLSVQSRGEDEGSSNGCRAERKEGREGYEGGERKVRDGEVEKEDHERQVKKSLSKNRRKIGPE